MRGETNYSFSLLGLRHSKNRSVDEAAALTGAGIVDGNDNPWEVLEYVRGASGAEGPPAPFTTAGEGTLQAGAPTGSWLLKALIGLPPCSWFLESLLT